MSVARRRVRLLLSNFKELDRGLAHDLEQRGQDATRNATRMQEAARQRRCAWSTGPRT